MKTTAVKIVRQDDDTVTVGGYGVVFGGVDLEGETFTKDTDFMLDLVPDKLVLYDHRSTGVKNTLGRASAAGIKPDESGIWVEAQLQRSAAYVAEITQLVKAGALGWSSGSVAHLVEREGKHIKQWPIVEFSLTPTPAEPRTLGVDIIKSLAADNPLLNDLLPDGEQDTPAESTVTRESEEKTIIKVTENNHMSEQDKPVTEVPDYVTKTEFENVQKSLETITGLLENAPALKRAGYIAPDSEVDHPEVKSFGDYLVAVKRGNHKRLTTVYKAVKDISSQTGTAGGYLIPDEFHARLMEIQNANSQILQRVTRQPVATDAGRFPSLDYSVTPTAGSGQTALAAGLSATATSPGAAYTEDQPTFKELAYAVRKEGGYVEVENEVIADSPFAIEALLTRLFSVTVTNKLERHVIRGSGAGEPEGILNAACAVGITPATNNVFAWADATTMVSRFKSLGGQPVWIIHPGIWPDIGNFETTGGGGVFQANMQAGLGQSLLGYPIIVSEHAPQDDASGAVILADLSAYILFEREQLSVAFSEHAAFTSAKGTWRFDIRTDGMAWLTAAITLADPTGSYTVSPFVYHND